MKKALCLMLAVLTLFAATACGKPEDDPGTDTLARSETIDEEETEDPAYVCDLPEDLSFNNETIHILYARWGDRDDEFAAADGGGAISSAIHDRQALVEERLEVQLDFIATDGFTVARKVRTDIQGGTGDYDIVVNGTFLSIIPAMTGDYLDLSQLRNIDTSKHYWTQGYNDMVTFTADNMQFLASGPITLSMFQLMYFTIYNKELFEANQIPDLYDAVMSGEWTLDYQYGISKDHYDDKDGVAGPSEGDSYGFVSGKCISVDPYPVAADVRMIVKDPETREMGFNAGAVGKLSDLADKVQRLYNDDSTYAFPYEKDIFQNYIIKVFADGNAMMATTLFLIMQENINELTAMSYGIAPMPKFSQDQKEYGSYIQDGAYGFGVSSGVKDAQRQEMCAAALEAMAYEGNRLIRPAYYDNVLSLRYMQDPQSKQILDLLFDTIYFDFSQICGGLVTSAVICNELRHLLTGTSNTIASSARSWERNVNRTLDKYNKTLAKRCGKP